MFVVTYFQIHKHKGPEIGGRYELESGENCGGK